MRRVAIDTLKGILLCTALGVWLGLATWACAAAGMPAADLLIVFAIGVTAYIYYRYRETRRDEFAHVLIAAVELSIPLAPAVRAYLHDRPPRNEYWPRVALFISILIPGLVIAWLWAWRRRFDLRVLQFAAALEAGESLTNALRVVPDVATREFRQAAAIGESTGQLGDCLRRSDREQLASGWLEIAPRLLYVLGLMSCILGVLSFLVAFVVPKYKAIFRDFGFALPATTQMLIDISKWDWEWWAIGLVQLLVQVAIIVVFVSPDVRWFTPLIGRFYRRDVEGQVLRMLGLLTRSQRTIPEALDFLIASGEFPAVALRRLIAAKAAVDRGEPLADALREARLLPSGMAPLVHAAEKARTLPWALGELGDHLSRRALHAARRLALTLSPLLLVFVAALVGFVALAMFLPLIDLLNGLST